MIRTPSSLVPVAALLAASLLAAPACGGRSATAEEPRTVVGAYEYGLPSPDGGTGRFYLGREISQVMGHQAAGWLERPERERRERPDRVVESLGLAPDDVVADIGAGTGYFSFRLADRVPDGRVLAVDIQREMLDLLAERAAERGVTNVVPVAGSREDPNLPDGEIDLALMVDAYHEFSHPREMMEALVADLVVGGRVVLVEYRGEDPSIPIKRLHRMTEAQAVAEMTAVGLEHVETLDFLPDQHVLVFRKP